MPLRHDTFYRLKRMHVAFALAAALLLASTVWMWVADGRRPWQDYQQHYHKLRGQPQHGVVIEQMELPRLPLDYHFRQVTRVDRCTTCHQGYDQPASRDFPAPLQTHPRLELFVGSNSPHPAADFGCTICHDGQGSATDFRWASHTPNDMAECRRWTTELGWVANPHWERPMHSKRFTESGCLKCHPQVVDLEPTRRFPDPPSSRLVAGYQLVRQYGCFSCHEIPNFADTTHKVGPSLRKIQGKLTAEYMADQIRKPSDVLPATRMPQLFGLVDHLSPEKRAETQRLEEAEVQAAIAYLQAMAENVDAPPAPSGVTEPPSADRGKKLFETQGCLACHQRAEFAQFHATQGPSLDNMAIKCSSAASRNWLTAWLRDPAKLAPATRMPNPQLPAVIVDGKRVSDPVADVVAFLTLNAKQDGRPAAEMAAPSLLSKGEGTANQNPPSQQTSKKNDSVIDGKKVLAARGCASCHDIPGLEQTPPIGPTLRDWGRKNVALLSFERIGEYVAKTRPADDYFVAALRAGQRQGFLWQKLREPRSFDYQVADRKPVAEQLKMGRFVLSDAERESIMTFALGLDESVPSPAVYRPAPARQAIITGRKVIDKYACAECHTLEFERWTIDGRSELVGMPRLDRAGRVLHDEDDEGRAVRFFTPWALAVVGGKKIGVGGPDVVLTDRQVTTALPPWGGNFSRLLYPILLAQAANAGTGGDESSAWTAVPPPLVGEGAKVQPDWLYRYLLDPVAIRPSTALRMPRFQLSPQEAKALTDCFAAAAGEYPANPVLMPQAAPLDIKKIDRAINLVRDRTTFCGKCHTIGNQSPTAAVGATLAPRLDDVGRRLRPDYLRRWLANPQAVVPYTPMPALFLPTGPALGQDIFPGTAQDQLDAVVDLLLRYDEYCRLLINTRAQKP